MEARSHQKQKPRITWAGFFRVLLIFLSVLLFAAITWLNSRWYSGVYVSGPGSALLLFSIILLVTPARNSRIPFARTVALSLICLLVCALAFLIFRPSCTLAQARRQLEAAGYTEVIPNPQYSHMGMVEDGNPLVNTGYVLRGILDGEAQVVFFNPVSGEWWRTD